MSRTGENIYLKKNGRWEGKYVKSKTGGRVQYGYVSGRSYEEVLRKKREKLRELEREDAAFGTSLLSDVSARWLESRRGFLKETTIGKYDSILKNYIIPEYGSRRLEELCADEIRLWLEKLAITGGENGRKLSAKSVNGIASVFRLIFQHAAQNEGIQAPELGEFHLKQPKKQVDILSRSDQNRLEKYLIEDMGPAGLGIMTSLYTGIRLGELCALRWGNIRQEDNVLDIHATMSRIRAEDGSGHKTKIVITPPKSECSIRQIPIPAGILAFMNEMRRADNSFFLTGKVENYMDPRTMQNRFKKALAECGIAPVGFHALRHTFATNCIEQDFDVKSLSEILGHANVSVTMNRYVHPTMDMKKGYMDRLALISEKN